MPGKRVYLAYEVRGRLQFFFTFFLTTAKESFVVGGKSDERRRERERERLSPPLPFSLSAPILVDHRSPTCVSCVSPGVTAEHSGEEILTQDAGRVATAVISQLWTPKSPRTSP